LKQKTDDDRESDCETVLVATREGFWHFVAGCIGKKRVAPRRAPELLDLGERHTAKSFNIPLQTGSLSNPVHSGGFFLVQRRFG